MPTNEMLKWSVKNQIIKIDRKFVTFFKRRFSGGEKKRNEIFK
jgi:Fe-S cluster assembly ATPase SufC